MIEIYSGLLDKIESRHYNVFGDPVSLSICRKLSIAGKALIGAKCPMLQARLKLRPSKGYSRLEGT